MKISRHLAMFVAATTLSSSAFAGSKSRQMAAASTKTSAKAATSESVPVPRVKASKSAIAGSSAVQGHVGFVTGLQGQEGMIPVFGADYMYYISKRTSIDAGLSYWQETRNEESFSTRVSDLNLDVGSSYHLPVASSSAVNLGGRLGQTSATFATDGEILGTSYSESESISSLYLAGSVGFGATGGKIIYGGDLRVPLMFFDEKFKEFSPKYLVGYVGMKI